MGDFGNFTHLLVITFESAPRKFSSFNSNITTKYENIRILFSFYTYELTEIHHDCKNRKRKDSGRQLL